MSECKKERVWVDFVLFSELDFCFSKDSVGNSRIFYFNFCFSLAFLQAIFLGWVAASMTMITVWLAHSATLFWICLFILWRKSPTKAEMKDFYVLEPHGLVQYAFLKNVYRAFSNGLIMLLFFSLNCLKFPFPIIWLSPVLTSHSVTSPKVPITSTQPNNAFLLVRIWLSKSVTQMTSSTRWRLNFQMGKTWNHQTLCF